MYLQSDCRMTWLLLIWHKKSSRCINKTHSLGGERTIVEFWTVRFHYKELCVTKLSMDWKSGVFPHKANKQLTPGKILCAMVCALFCSVWLWYWPILPDAKASVRLIKYKKKIFLASHCSCLFPVHWSLLLGGKWRCNWNSADKRCPTTSESSTILLRYVLY